jgi:23S rRNA (cytosine1962-C5)-methyltransferase
VNTVAEQAEMLANRARKNFRRLRGPLERKGAFAFRVYDWDIPELRMVVDWYEGHLVCAEYSRTQTDAIPGWLESMAGACAGALEVEPEKVHLRKRHTRPAPGGEGERYQRLSTAGAQLEVREAPLRFLVNLDDYLDTGLFNDHRETRARVRAEANGARMLNLFCYTGTFTCAAAAGGARETVSVDVSGRYLDWARDNLAVNGFLGGPDKPSGPHAFVRRDAREYLQEASRNGERFSLIILDPPSFSTRDGAEDLDIQRDHPALIAQTLQILDPGGVLWFSTNHQRFEPHLEGLAATAVREVTDETLPPDYRRKAHRSFRIVK